MNNFVFGISFIDNYILSRPLDIYLYLPYKDQPLKEEQEINWNKNNDLLLIFVYEILL